MTRNNKSTKSTKSTKTHTNNKPTWKDNPMMRELLMMHTYCRPSGSATEAKFCALYIDSLPGCTTDEAGNRIITVPMANGAAPRVLWSSHTDTVHRVEGIQKITYGDGIIGLPVGSTSSCLGADCTVGVWLMRQMILRGAPGLYIFHAAEEVEAMVPVTLRPRRRMSSAASTMPLRSIGVAPPVSSLTRVVLVVPVMSLAAHWRST